MTTKGDVLIKVDNVHKVYANNLHALNGVSETISKGEVVVIVGPSGSGKSTFLRSLNLLEVPTSGHIYFEGVDITSKATDINKHRQKMGIGFIINSLVIAWSNILISHTASIVSFNVPSCNFSYEITSGYGSYGNSQSYNPLGLYLKVLSSQL